MANSITSYFYEGVNKNTVSLKNEDAVSFLIHDNSNIVLDIDSFNKDNKISIVVGNNSFMKLRLLVLENINSLEINVNVPRGSNFDLIIADFSDEISSFKSLVNLEGENSESSVHLATLSSKNNKKKFTVSFNHKVGKTKSLIVLIPTGNSMLSRESQFSKVYSPRCSRLSGNSTNVNAVQFWNAHAPIDVTPSLIITDSIIPR